MGNTEFIDFAYWWSFSGGGSAINGASPSSLRTDVVITDQTTRKFIFFQTTYYVHNLLSLLKHVFNINTKNNKTQFQIKGGRSVRRRDIFDVSGKRYKYFLKALSTRKFLCEEETYKKS